MATQSIEHVQDTKHKNHFSDHIFKIKSYTYLANAIFHLRDKSNLDKRTYFITWPIPNRQMMQQKKYFFVRVIKNLVKKIDPSAEWGMIVAGDFGGTRYQSPRFGEAGQAHLHATLVLPFDFPVKSLHAAISMRLLKDSRRDGVQLASSVVDFRQYQPDKPYWYALDYFNKGEKYLPSDWNFSPYIYPVDRFRRGRRKTIGTTNIPKNRSFDAEIERIRDELLFDPRSFFSDLASCGLSDDHRGCLDEFELIADQEKPKMKMKLINLIKIGRTEPSILTIANLKEPE